MTSLIPLLVALATTSPTTDVATPASAPSTATTPLRVGLSPIAPFVYVPKDAGPKGFEIDVIRDVATTMDRPIEFVPFRTVAETLRAVQAGDVDVGIGGISVTREREVGLDFTWPLTEDGLGILTRKNAGPGVLQTISGVMNRARLSVLFGFVLLIVVAGHLVWWAERGSPSFHDAYKTGVFEGMYWAIVTASTVGYGDKAPLTWPGRVVAALVIVVSLPMFAIFTAELASAITLQSVEQSNIESPKDLAGRKVAAVRGTTGAAWANTLGAELIQRDDLDEVVKAVADGAADAAVYDAPALKLMAQESKGALTLASGIYDVRDVAFVVNNGSPLREQFNRQLLSLREEGVLAQLRLTWFGQQ